MPKFPCNPLQTPPPIPQQSLSDFYTDRLLSCIIDFIWNHIACGLLFCFWLFFFFLRFNHIVACTISSFLLLSKYSTVYHNCLLIVLLMGIWVACIQFFGIVSKMSIATAVDNWHFIWTCFFILCKNSKVKLLDHIINAYLTL